MLTSYADTTGGPVTWLTSDRFHAGTANMKFAVSGQSRQGARLELYRICATTLPGPWQLRQEQVHRGPRLACLVRGLGGYGI
jgi:hypothetical protein